MSSVLCLVGHYLPGYRAGGALRSVAELARVVAAYSEFRVLTSDRDLGDSDPYAGIRTNTWVRFGEYSVCYSRRRAWEILSILRDSQADILYVNSFFDPYFGILPVVATRVYGRRWRQIIIAPRGEFSSGALRLKRIKKRLFIKVARLSGLYRGVVWHASTELEAADIRRVFGSAASDVRVAQDLASPSRIAPGNAATDSQVTDRVPLRLCFLSRISAKKNLAYAMSVLRGLDIPAVFDVYGPAEDQAYLAQCRSMSEALPGNIEVHFHGSLEHERVAEVLARHHLFVLPTHGENFGHVIAESLAVGTPVLISDQTPWRDLEQHGVGWDLPLSNPDAFLAAIQSVSAMDAAAYAAMRVRASRHSLGRSWADQVRDTLSLFGLQSEATNASQHESPSCSAGAVTR